MTFVVITTVKYEPSFEDNALEAGMKTIRLCKSQIGLQYISFNQSKSLNETLMYWEWKAESDYKKFMESEEWEKHSNNLRLVLPFDKIKFSSQSYEQIA